jgi:hypothetical protein
MQQMLDFEYYYSAHQQIQYRVARTLKYGSQAQRKVRSLRAEKEVTKNTLEYDTLKYKALMHNFFKHSTSLGKAHFWVHQKEFHHNKPVGKPLSPTTF